MSNDAPPKNQKFQLKQEFPYDLLCDEDLTMSIAYSAAQHQDDGKAKRISYLIGPDGKVLKAYPKVSPPNHPQEVLDDIPS